MPSRDDDAIVAASNAGERRQEKQRKRGGHKREPLTKGQIRRSQKRRARNKAMYHEMVKLAAEQGIELADPIPTTDLLEKVFRRTHALWIHAATEVDRLDPDAPAGKPGSLWTYKIDENGNKIVEPSKWVQYENALRQELFEQAAMAQKLNLDEAKVRIEAAQLQLLGQALKNAAKRTGLDDETQRQLGANLRRELSVIEGTAHDAEPSPAQLPAQAA